MARKNKSSTRLGNDEWSIGARQAGAYFDETILESIMRELESNPIYSQGELLLHNCGD